MEASSTSEALVKINGRAGMRDFYGHCTALVFVPEYFPTTPPRVFGGSDGVGIVCDTVGFSGAAPGDESRKIGPVPLFNGKNQGRIRIQSSPCAMGSNTGSGEMRTTSSTQA